MKLAVLLLILATSWRNAETKSTESSNNINAEDLLRRAASQLERLSVFRRSREPLITIPEIRLEENSLLKNGSSEMQERIIEAQKRIDELRESASAVLRDPRYAAIMQDRIKRSMISGIANKLVGGAVGAVSRGISGLSSSSSPAHQYGSYGHSYESQFNIWDFKKAIINTLIQAIKAIGGGAIAGGGALVKGGGYLVSAKGRFISSAGEAISALGKSLASSAIISSGKPVYGPPAYSYGHPGVSYDGPPPSVDAYVGPENAYHADNSGYASPSNDDGVDDDAGVLIVKQTKPSEDEEHAPISSEHSEHPNLSALEESFGGPSSQTLPTKQGSSTITKIIGVLNSGQPIANQYSETSNYYPEHKEPPPISNSLHQEHSIYENHQSAHDNGNYVDYQSNGQIYDSYGTKLNPSSPQLAESHVNTHGYVHETKNHASGPSIEVQGFYNPQITVPAPSGPSNYDYQYQQPLEPLKISITESSNHLDQDRPISDHYGNGDQPIMIDHHHTQNYNLPTFPLSGSYGAAFGHLNYPVLGVWGRMDRRGSYLKRSSLERLHRPFDYRMMRGKLVRI